MNSVAETAGYVGQEKRVNFAFTFKGGDKRCKRNCREILELKLIQGLVTVKDGCVNDK